MTSAVPWSLQLHPLFCLGVLQLSWLARCRLHDSATHTAGGSQSDLAIQEGSCVGGRSISALVFSAFCLPTFQTLPI